MKDVVVVPRSCGMKNVIDEIPVIVHRFKGPIIECFGFITNCSIIFKHSWIKRTSILSFFQCQERERLSRVFFVVFEVDF